jgi:uncharacterized lipoprotein YmbA
VKRLLTIIALTLAACGTPEVVETSPDGQSDKGLSAGKADGEAFSQCELTAVLDLVNQPDVTEQSLKHRRVFTLRVHPGAG